jgi:hypothetical protein
VTGPCLPLIEPEFLGLVTGVDVSDTASVEALILVTSGLIGEELGGCVDPTTASMKLRVVAAQYTAYVMSSGSGTSGPAAIRAEQVGDYRVEYQRAQSDQFDLQVLRDMLASMHGGSAYSVSTLSDVNESSSPHVDYWDPSYQAVLDGKRGLGFPDGELSL